MGNILSYGPLSPDHTQEELQALCSEHPISLHMKVESVRANKEEHGHDDHGGETDLNGEQLVNLHGSLNESQIQILGDVANLRDSKYHIIIVVDRSGSMAGNPIDQVKLALKGILGQVIGNPKVVVDVILYNHQAETVKYSPSDYKDKIGQLHAGGTTSFEAAFKQTEKVIKGVRGQQFQETTIIFLTDGNDTVGGSHLDKCLKNWKSNLKYMCGQVVVHVVGFSRDHDLELLRRISASGTNEGIYRYCEPRDGPAALKDKLSELFEYVNHTNGYPFTFDLTFENNDDILTMNGSNSGRLDGTMKIAETGGDTDVSVAGDFWVHLSEPELFPMMSASIEISMGKSGKNYTLRIPCVFGSQERVIHKDESSISLWDLSVLSRDTDLLTQRVSKAVTDENVDEMELKKTLDHFQNKLSSTKLCNPAYDKATRAEMMGHIKDVQGKLDTLHELLALQLSGTIKNISLLARAHDLRYQAKFSKVRRQRLMNRRVAQNLSSVRSDAEKACVASQEELSALSEEAENFFFCILSLTSVKDILLDSSGLENAIGLGLAVTRPEHVLDNPTSLQVWSISGALVSRSSLMDAFECKISVEGPLATHGGFSFKSSDDDTDVSHATVGASREPINAWLPLFITPTHWARVKSCLKQSLGYLCTLDPLGYASNQLDIFFMVLGNMIGQLSECQVGENQLKLIYAMIRTCRACMDDFGLKEGILQKVENFLKHPNGRFRNEIPNLFTLIGYLVTLPVSDVNNIFLPYMDKANVGSNKNVPKRLWLGIISEMLRRSVSRNGDLGNDTKLINILNLLLHGSQDKGQNIQSSDLSPLFGQYNWLMATNQLETRLDIPEYDPNEGLELPQVVVNHSAKVDRAMDFWAQNYCSDPEGKKTSAQLSEAKGIIKKWIGEIRANSGLPMDAGTNRKSDGNMMIDIAIETPPRRKAVANDEAAGACARAGTDPSVEDSPTVSLRDCSQMTLLALKETAQILTQLSEHCFPRLTSVPGCMGFLDYWLTNCDGSGETNTSALPSADWIQGMKESVQRVYATMNNFKKECFETPPPSEDNDTHRDESEDGQGGHNTPSDSCPEKDYIDEDENRSYRNQNNRTGDVVTLPMLLAALGLTDNSQVQLIRSMICQAVSYSSNSQARGACDDGRFLDLTEEGNDEVYLSQVENDLTERKESAKAKMARKAALKYGNESMLQAKTIWAFIGYLLKTYTERGDGFKELISMILNLPDARKHPLLAEMVRILLTGKYEGFVVFAKGNMWVPELKIANQFKLLLGEDVWVDIETELLSNVSVHVYRESGIPNRQGHSNAYPYIPDRIRTLMGLPLLDELPPNPDRRKKVQLAGKSSRRR